MMIIQRQPGDLGVLRRVAEGVAEEARTRGFASPALAGFAFVNKSASCRRWGYVNSGMYLAG